MDYITNEIFIVYYIGVFFIIFGFIYLIYFHFKEDENIKLKEHIGIIILYISLLILAIYMWGVIINFIFTLINKIEIYKKMMEFNIG